MTEESEEHLPWIRFYPSDHRADAALRMCSFEAQAIWVHLFCIMHDEGEPYGHLSMNENPLTKKDLAKLLGTTERVIKKNLEELEKFGVFSRNEEGLIFSRRLVRDRKKHLRNVANGRGGGNPALNRGDNPQNKPRYKAQYPDSNNQNQKPKKTVGTPAERKFRIKPGTPQWNAWEKHLGQSLPVDRDFGWSVVSEWPPSYETKPGSR